MTTLNENSTKLVAVFLKRRNGRDEMRFVPTCAGCGELVMNLVEANVAVRSIGGPLKRAGTYRGARVSRIEAPAAVFCWACDQNQKHNIPWLNAALVFRNRDDAAQQRLEPAFRCVTKREDARGPR